MTRSAPARVRPGRPPRRGPAVAADGFRRNLVWSGTAHGFLLGGVFLAVALERDPGFAPPSAAFIELGMSGPNPNPSLGSPAPAPPPAPPPVEEPAPEEAPPPPAPEPAPPEERPGLVRPTVEDRDRMPVPDARERRSDPVERPESGLRGADAAWAESAPLAPPPETETEPPPPAVDTKSRPARRSAAARTGSGAGGIGLGGAPGGARFDQDFEYSFYQRQMIARIQANWQQIPVRGQTRVVIRFTIFRDGTISGAEVEDSSGQDLLDRAALRAVVLAEPFPRLPESYPRDRVGVHLLFTYGETAGDIR